MARIVFVNPPVSAGGRGDLRLKREVSVPPEGLCSLAAVTRSQGHETRIVDSLALGLGFQGTVKEILSHEPTHVGITSTTISIHDAARLAGFVKEAAPAVTTVLGGAHVTVLPIRTMETFPQFDLAVVGEGERTIAELLDAAEQKKDLASVPGLALRLDGKVHLTPKREFIDDLDELPMPAWDLLPDLRKHYRQSTARAARLPAASIVSSRGCPGRCIFCARPVFGNRLRAFSAEYLLAMIAHLKDAYGIRSIVFNDDNFVVFRKRLEEFCELLRREKLKITWSCFSRVDTVDEELLGLMREGGCTDVAYGIESGSQEILDFAGKGISIEQIHDAVSWAKKARIRVTGYFIFGFPLETPGTIEETIRLAKELPLDNALFSYMVPYPGSRLYEMANEYGTFTEDWSKMNQWNITFVPNGLTRECLEEAMQRAFREFYLRPRIILGHARRMLHPSTFGRTFKEGTRLLRSIARGRAV